MTKIVKIGQNLVECWSQAEVDKLPNVGLGRHCRINTNNILMKNNRLNKYVNNSTMGTLDNYANHENMNIYITPLENDMFHDVRVSVFKEHNTIAEFPLKINDSKNGLHDFLKELYQKVAPQKPVEKMKKADKPQKVDDVKLFLGEVVDNIKNFRLNQIRKFIENHQNGNGVARTMADVFEEVHYNDLYK